MTQPKPSDLDDGNDESDALGDYIMSTATMETDNQSSTHARSPAKKETNGRLATPP
jgi:hypothetical protein